MPRASGTRAKGGPKALQMKPIQRLGPTDQLVDLVPSPTLLQHHPHLPATLRVRAIRYRRPGFRPQMLLTSVLDPVAFPAAAVAALYHHRWEIERGFDEMQTHTLEREESLRSKTPARIRQEVWGSRWVTTWCASRWRASPSRLVYRQPASAFATRCSSSASSGSPPGPRVLASSHAVAMHSTKTWRC
jgi:hypothetical protein